jgi:hypothetical protein
MMSEPDRDAVQVETQVPVDSTVLAAQSHTKLVRPLLVRDPFLTRRHAE